MVSPSQLGHFALSFPFLVSFSYFPKSISFLSLCDPVMFPLGYITHREGENTALGNSLPSGYTKSPNPVNSLSICLSSSQIPTCRRQPMRVGFFLLSWEMLRLLSTLLRAA